MSKLLIFLFPFIFLFSSCEEIDFYEQSVVINEHLWKRGDTIRGEFLISDTTVNYDIFLVLRHTDAYKYNNIWLEMGLKGPSDSLSVQKLDITLGSDAGGWEGSGMNDIREVRKKLTPFPRKFLNPGSYRYQIRQVMRDNPLQHVISVGLRVQAAR
jgi:gliding motility-associated lipoprotein GldH